LFLSSANFDKDSSDKQEDISPLYKAVDDQGQCSQSQYNQKYKLEQMIYDQNKIYHKTMMSLKLRKLGIDLRPVVVEPVKNQLLLL
jgi:hypothetical protein